jgi:RNA 2',3'-cyclic 3'-phosphodiesterase
VRLFLALDIDSSIRQRIARLVEGVREFAPEARWVRPESLHITLKFIGERQAEWAEKLKESLTYVRAPAFDVSFRGYGFFPTHEAARVFWMGIAAGTELVQLASAVDGVCATLGIPREEHAFSPHLTLARGGRSGSPRRQKFDKSNTKFQRLQDKLAAMPAPDFGTMTAREFFLFESKLSAGGSLYTKVARFGLG